MQQAVTQQDDSPAGVGISRHRLVWVRWASIASLVVGLLLIISVLPVREASQWLESWITGLGIWGPVAFVAVYIVAALLMIPGSALALVAGAIFSLGVATAVASVGATTGAAAAFLTARYLARDKVVKRFGKHPKFNAIDQAVGECGWKIVVLLRLSPVLPFNLQNYFYGLTAIRFWPATLASWVGMFPWVFLYTYLGHVGRVTAVEGTDAIKSTTWGQVALIVVGLISTVAVTIYVTRLATRAIRQRASQPGESQPSNEEPDVPTPNQTHRGGIVLMAIVGVMTLGAGAYARMNPQLIQGYLVALAGPPAVTLAEAYEELPPDVAVVFDHAPFNDLLQKHVDTDGWVDYKALLENADTLDSYLASLANAPFDELGRDEKLAYLINAYNAFTLRLILDHYPVKSIKDIPDAERWDAVRWELAVGDAGKLYSLNQIEHELIRPKFKEPRIHFALVCAAYSCLKLRNEAYTGEKLEEQLSDQTVYTHAHDRWFRFDQANHTVYLTALYNWYGGDFLAVSASVLDYAAEHSPELRAALDTGQQPTVRWLDYDWKLNDISNAP